MTGAEANRIIAQRGNGSYADYAHAHAVTKMR
jgi:hypothetical protein